MSLAHLSLYRCKRGSNQRAVPPVPTNEERICQYRARVPSGPNRTDWRFSVRMRERRAS